MANIKSQKKRIKTNEKARVRNKAVRSALRTYTKRFTSALESGDQTAATEALQKVSKELDKAASKGVIHRNNAANHKSTLAKRLNSLSS